MKLLTVFLKGALKVYTPKALKFLRLEIPVYRTLKVHVLGHKVFIYIALCNLIFKALKILI